MNHPWKSTDEKRRERRIIIKNIRIIKTARPSMKKIIKIIRIITNTVNPKDSGQISTDGHIDCSRSLLIINPKIEHYT